MGSRVIGAAHQPDVPDRVVVVGAVHGDEIGCEDVVEASLSGIGLWKEWPLASPLVFPPRITEAVVR